MTNCDIQIWHTLAEVELFILLLQYICLILFCYFFLFCDLFFVYKNLYLLSCLPT